MTAVNNHVLLKITKKSVAAERRAPALFQGCGSHSGTPSGGGCRGARGRRPCRARLSPPGSQARSTRLGEVSGCLTQGRDQEGRPLYEDMQQEAACFRLCIKHLSLLWSKIITFILLYSTYWVQVNYFLLNIILYF